MTTQPPQPLSAAEEARLRFLHDAPEIDGDWLRLFATLDAARSDGERAAREFVESITVREPAGAGLREALERHLDRIKDGLDHGNIADDCSTMDCPIYLGIESWDAVLRALASPAEPGLDVERLRWAKWISEVGDTWPIVAQGDWACAECRPTSDLIEPGWRCVIHEARAALSGPKS